MSSSSFARVKSILRWSAPVRQGIIALFIVIIFFMELAEFEKPTSYIVHLIEFSGYAVFLVVIGYMIELLLQNMTRLNLALSILDIKHKTSLELDALEDWDALIQKILLLPQRLVSADVSGLLVYNASKAQFETIASWSQDGQDLPAHNYPASLIESFFLEGGYQFTAVPPLMAGGIMDHSTYWIPLVYRKHLFAILFFRLQPDQSLTVFQEKILENINDEITHALIYSQDRRSNEEKRQAEVILNERRKVSYFLHDDLGQNLGYLRLKLGQYMMEKDRLTPDQSQSDLERMHFVATDSYEKLRCILEDLQLQTSPQLTNVLREHTLGMAERIGITMDFHTDGKPLNVCAEVQRAIFYTFREVLSNIEKHSMASRGKVSVIWLPDALNITISDDGIGFVPQEVNTRKHFGIGIAQERLASVNGKFEIQSSNHQGTTVLISVPIIQMIGERV